MGGACSTYRRRRETQTRLWWGNLKEEDFLEDIGLDGNAVLKMDLKETGREGVRGINLAYDTDQWRAVVNTVMNLRFP
jgi:hypothetical protein